ncbi:MAG: hypothetical protein ACREA2_21800 [Blastocatellia bacterium]
MSKLALTGVLSLLLCFCRAPAWVAQTALEGDWIGGWQVKGDWVSVKAQFNNEKGTLGGSMDLQQPVVKVDPSLFDQYGGSYRLSSDNFISIGRQTNTGADLRLVYVERASGRRGHLTPLAENIFVGGPALGVGYPIDVKVTFVINARGESVGLKWQSGGSAEKTAAKIKIREEEVKFRAHVRLRQ